ncbi:MAG: hypothetical protein JXR51_06300 [Bacteroidales bacterium]|nr:hypothetical protein [Bacteroidales bacterium]MBN2756772.1 hypothetical protein [Bacteroidales bacterium]
MNIEENIKLAAEAIKNSDALLITAGAGIGVDSGLPDFRGNSGFWREYPAIAKLGKSFSEMANPVWFEKDPKVAWAFYGHRLNLYRKINPHSGFDILLNEAKQKKYGYFVFTSNVDGQFQKAGFDNDKIDECHGSIHHLQCSKPCSHKIWSTKDIDIEVDMNVFEALEPFPLCPECGSIARPNILMFGDWAWLSDRNNEQSSRFNKWVYNLKNNNAKIAIIEMGAGHAIPTVRMHSQHTFRNLSANLIRINPRDYDVPQGGISIPLESKEGIERIFEMI